MSRGQSLYERSHTPTDAKAWDEIDPDHRLLYELAAAGDVDELDEHARPHIRNAFALNIAGPSVAGDARRKGG